MRPSFIRLDREIARHAIGWLQLDTTLLNPGSFIRTSHPMVVERRQKLNPRLFIRETGAELYLDVEHSTLQVGHDTAEVGLSMCVSVCYYGDRRRTCHSPDKRIVVNKFNVHVHRFIFLIVLNCLLILPLKIGGDSTLLLDRS